MQPDNLEHRSLKTFSILVPTLQRGNAYPEETFIRLWQTFPILQLPLSRDVRLIRYHSLLKFEIRNPIFGDLREMFRDMRRRNSTKGLDLPGPV